MSLTMTGLDQVMKNFLKIEEKAQRNLEKSLIESGHIVLSESNTLVPVNTGGLLRSGSVKSKDPLEAEVEYDADYALQVHEDLEAFHPQGQSKYLEVATKDSKNKVMEKIRGDLLK